MRNIGKKLIETWKKKTNSAVNPEVVSCGHFCFIADVLVMVVVSGYGGQSTPCFDFLSNAEHDFCFCHALGRDRLLVAM